MWRFNGKFDNIYQVTEEADITMEAAEVRLWGERPKMRLSSPLSFLQVILPILWTRGPGQMRMVN
jgi:hypothetical protein